MSELSASMRSRSTTQSEPARVRRSSNGAPGYRSFLLKLDPNKPSPTIQVQPGPNVGPFQWDNRRLRVGERRRLSRKRASATREYIGSVQDIVQLVTGDGEFESLEEFYRYWRSTARDWKKSPEAEQLLRRTLEDSD